MDERSCRGEGERQGRRPYQPPSIESEEVLEKNLLILCYSFFEGCEQDPPQS